MTRKLICHVFLSVLLSITFSAAVSAQTLQPQLTATILHLDSAFWNAYNNCDTTEFKKYVTDDIEFYHDKGGITLGAKALIATLNKNLCSNPDYHLRREAVAGTVKVFPMQNGNDIYGAIITGEHVFYITNKGKPEYLDGDANFTHLWLIETGVWKMKRVLSYNHHEATHVNTRTEAATPGAQLDQLSGTYKSSQSGTMTIARKDSVLLLSDAKNTYILYPQSDTTFFTKDRDLLIQFVKDAVGKPLKIIVKEHGAVADELLFENRN